MINFRWKQEIHEKWDKKMKPTFSEPLMTKYPPGSSGHSLSSVRSRSDIFASIQYEDLKWYKN